ncbi:MAG: hypothetical protein CSA50_05090 [Gammaproteobacteria bacterium]|nr:MAG: hypothetical protein CSA50_05090 [Gammaproteobacteria bacterium]
MTRFNLLVKIFSLTLVSLVSILLIGYLASDAILENDTQNIRKTILGALQSEAKSLATVAQMQADLNGQSKQTSLTRQTWEAILPDAARQEQLGIQGILVMAHTNAILYHQISEPPIMSIPLDKLKFDLIPLLNQAAQTPHSSAEAFTGYITIDENLFIAAVSRLQRDPEPVSPSAKVRHNRLAKMYLVLLQSVSNSKLAGLTEDVARAGIEFVALPTKRRTPDLNRLTITGVYGNDIGSIVWRPAARDPVASSLLIFGTLALTVIVGLGGITFYRLTADFSTTAEMTENPTGGTRFLSSVNQSLAILSSNQPAKKSIGQLIDHLESIIPDSEFIGMIYDPNNTGVNSLISKRLNAKLAEALSRRVEPVNMLHAAIELGKKFKLNPNNEQWRNYLKTVQPDKIQFLYATPFTIETDILGCLITYKVDSKLLSQQDYQLIHTCSEVMALAIQKEAGATSSQQSLYQDPITHLVNRRVFQICLEQALNLVYRFGKATHHSTSIQVTALCFGVNQFSRVNEQYGHDVGDRALQELAGRLTRAASANDTIARFGGDQFALMTTQCKQLGETTRLVNHIRGILCEPLILDELTLQLDIVASVLFISNTPDTPRIAAEQALTQLESTLHDAKKATTGFRYCDRELDELGQRFSALHTSIPEALSNDTLEVFYLPLIDIRNNTLAGLEALVRWQHPVLARTDTNDIITAAEITDEIVRIDLEVLRKACAKIKQVNQQNQTNLTLSLNISGYSLSNENIFSYIAQLLQQTFVRPDLIRLEVNHDWLIDHTDQMLSLSKQIAGSGITFGVGKVKAESATAANLSAFPIQQIKLDQSCIKTLSENAQVRQRTSALLALSRTLGAETVAVGVESDHQLAWLKSQGVDYIQGYLIGRPLSNDQLLSEIDAINLKLQQDFS